PRVEVDLRVVEGLQEPGDRPAEERHQRDGQVGAHHPGLGSQVLVARLGRRGRGHDRGSTMTLPDIAWWAIPQYSWQMIANSRGWSKRAATCAIWPGRAITLTLASGIQNPWTTSLLVSQKCTVDPAGTRFSPGANAHTCASIRTSYWPGAIAVTPSRS